MAKALPLELMWRARRMYEEKDELGRQKYSMREVAAYLGISETSVLRAVTNTGRFANMNNNPLPKPKMDKELEQEAEASLEKLQRLLAAERAERTPGSTRADKWLDELNVSPEVKERVKQFLIPEGSSDERREEGSGASGTAGKPVSPLDE